MVAALQSREEMTVIGTIRLGALFRHCEECRYTHRMETRIFRFMEK
jgi:hypothetical protein